jgi:hypothetical protein
VAVQAWRDDYPWLQLAFRQTEAKGRALAEEWRWRIEEDLKAPLDYQVRDDGTAAVWCGMCSLDFKHEPTPKDLLHGLDSAYRQELERRGWQYPDLNAAASADASAAVSVGTRSGPSCSRRRRVTRSSRRSGAGEAATSWHASSTRSAAHGR